MPTIHVFPMHFGTLEVDSHALADMLTAFAADLRQHPGQPLKGYMLTVAETEGEEGGYQVSITPFPVRAAFERKPKLEIIRAELEVPR